MLTVRQLSVLAVALSAACSGGGDPCGARWNELWGKAFLDRPLLSIYGRGKDVYLAGGGVGAVTEPKGLVMHWDGGSWSKVEAGAGQTYWWIWGPADGGPGDLWLVGDHGTAAHWDGRLLYPVSTGTQATLFGVWGSAEDDVWIVGGTPGGGTGAPNDLVFHWDGRELTPAGPPARGAAFFKVWGAGRDDMWVVGENGVIWHRTAAGWTSYDDVTPDTLTTVHGCGASEVYAVGAQAVYRWDGMAWTQTAARPLSDAVGVHCGHDQVLVVGNGGLKLRYVRATDRWLDETLQAPFYTDFHAAWISPDGDLWASGGNYNAPMLGQRYGMMAFQGCPIPR